MKDIINQIIGSVAAAGIIGVFVGAWHFVSGLKKDLDSAWVEIRKLKKKE